MTLRARLITALAVLVTAGLAAFGYATYARYSNAEYQRLDDGLRSALPVVSRQLVAAVGLDRGGRGRPDRDDAINIGSFPTLQTVYAELRDPTGAIVARLAVDDTPQLDDGPVRLGITFTTGAATGSGRWRVTTAQPAGRLAAGYQVLLATTTDEVTESLQELLLIEVIGGVAILAVLVGGSWLILRRGLRPLEEMSRTASSINAGDLSQRVQGGDAKSEVGQLATALNGMLDEIETAFRARKDTEHRLRQFLADASHELRTPLTSIQGFAEIFRLGREHEHVDQAVIMRRIEEESARMKLLVEDLLLLARLDETRIAERSDVDLTVLAADACSDAVALDPTRTVSLDAAGPVVVPGNADHLRQAVTNLVSNAVKHTPTGTAIDLRVTTAGNRAVLTVRDHGPGLTEEALQHVFERFWRADESRTGTGAGLGLAIVESIAREHGGTASAANAQDGGAEFTITLPIETAESNAGASV